MDFRTPLSPDLLRRTCDPARIPFETTAAVDGPPEVLGQERALEALRFGTGMRHDGFNLFVMGPSETGRHAAVRDLLAARARSEPVPPDVCYVQDFGRPDRPRSLTLPPGRGRALRRDLDALVEDLRTAIPAALESEEHRRRKDALADEWKERHESAINELRADAKARGIALLRTPLGFAFAPLKDGEVITSERYEALPEDDRKRIEGELAGLQERLREILSRMPQQEKELRERVSALVREATLAAVGHRIDETARRYADLPAVVAWLEALKLDVLEHADDFLKPSEGGALSALMGLESAATGEHGAFRRYRVNLLVDHAETAGAPVVHEDHPTYQNLVGRVEHLSQLGALVTDFRLVRAGALHRANGGYLVMDARELLTQPYAWDGLKHALLSREIRIESLGQMLSLMSTVSLEPEPIPLRVKVVLVGERFLYYLLDALDPEFHSLFKVAADFEDDLPRTEEAEARYARLVGALARRERSRPLDRGAVAAVVERAARMADDSGRLTARVEAVADLLREADDRAGAAGHDRVSRGDVEGAIEAAERRVGRVRERVLEEIARGTILIDVAGAKVGQVNGLSVSRLGHLEFGRPARITARVRLGKGDVVDIEREVELGGPVHSKGVLILAGFLGGRYAKDHPLSLSASLVFEQSYGPIEGDSASSAELYALLSALAEAPLSQALAVTGSVNQRGEVQAIGGVNEKIEGFFDACAARGLSGEQGVVIPASNVRHLMLRPDVVAAAAAGRFRVHAVETIDQGLSLLTGLEAGERDAAGRFPPGSVNARVEARLVALAERRVALGAGPAKEREASP